MAGALGRMGQAIVQATLAQPGALLASAWERAGHGGVGVPHPLAPSVVVAAAPEGDLDVLIDFTAPSALAGHLTAARALGTALVVGTTGLEPEHHRLIDEAAAHIAVLQAANTSVGVNVLLALVESATRLLGPAFDPEITEIHHGKKKDAPSGTAVELARRVERVRPELRRVTGRDGLIGERQPDELGVLALRGGDVVGEHTVFYFGRGERLELTHRATDRGIFAQGAVRAAMWLAGRPAGRYGMAEALGVTGA